MADDPIPSKSDSMKRSVGGWLFSGSEPQPCPYRKVSPHCPGTLEVTDMPKDTKTGQYQIVCRFCNVIFLGHSTCAVSDYKLKDVDKRKWLKYVQTRGMMFPKKESWWTTWRKKPDHPSGLTIRPHA
jgi:hypothetical protein